jgi:hypothetical protein
MGKANSGLNTSLAMEYPARAHTHTLQVCKYINRPINIFNMFFPKFDFAKSIRIIKN